MKLGCSIAKIERAEQQIAKAQASVDGLRGLGVASSSRITISDADGSVVVEEAPPKRRLGKRKRQATPEDPEAERRGMMRMELRLLEQSEELYQLSCSLREMRLKRFGR